MYSRGQFFTASEPAAGAGAGAGAGMDTTALHTLLNHVVRGEEDLARNILIENPDLLYAKATVQDPSGRLFDNISPFQYMLWALDARYMGQMMLSIIPEDASGQAIKEQLLEQYAEVEAGIEYVYQGTRCRSSHYDFSIIKPLMTYRAGLIAGISPAMRARLSITGAMSDAEWIEGEWCKSMCYPQDDLEEGGRYFLENLQQALKQIWPLYVQGQGDFPMHVLQRYAALDKPFASILSLPEEPEDFSFETFAADKEGAEEIASQAVTSQSFIEPMLNRSPCEFKVIMEGAGELKSVVLPASVGSDDLKLGRDFGILGFSSTEALRLEGHMVGWDIRCFDNEDSFRDFCETGTPQAFFPLMMLNELTAFRKLQNVCLSDCNILKTSLEDALKPAMSATV